MNDTHLTVLFLPARVNLGFLYALARHTSQTYLGIFQSHAFNYVIAFPFGRPKEYELVRIFVERRQG